MVAFSLVSPDFKDGDYIPMAHALSADFGFGCAGQTVHRFWNGLIRRQEQSLLLSPYLILMPPLVVGFGIGWWLIFPHQRIP